MVSARLSPGFIQHKCSALRLWCAPDRLQESARVTNCSAVPPLLHPDTCRGHCEHAVRGEMSSPQCQTNCIVYASHNTVPASGMPLMMSLLWQIDGKRQLLMVGQGASPEGNKPFLDLLDLDTKESTRLWQSSPPYLESVGSIMSDNNDVSSCAF